MGLLCYVEGSFPPVQPRQRAILNPPTHFKWPFPSLLICELVIAAHQPIHAHGEWLFPTYPNMAHNFSQLNHTRQMVLPHLPNHDKWFLPTYPHTANGSSPPTHASTANGSFPPTQPRQMVLTNLPTHGKWLFPTYSCIHGKWIFPTYPTTANGSYQLTHTRQMALPHLLMHPRQMDLSHLPNHDKWFLPTYPHTANGSSPPTHAFTANGSFPPTQPRQMPFPHVPTCSKIGFYPPIHPRQMAISHLSNHGKWLFHLPTRTEWLFPTYLPMRNGSSLPTHIGQMALPHFHTQQLALLREVHSPLSIYIQVAPIPMSPGDALIFHCELKHFTPPNKTKDRM